MSVAINRKSCLFFYPVLYQIGIGGGETLKIIADLRTKKGWNQKELADQLTMLDPSKQVKQAHISQWETGRRTPSLKNAQKLASVFGITVSELLVETGDSNGSNKTGGNSRQQSRDHIPVTS